MTRRAQHAAAALLAAALGTTGCLDQLLGNDAPGVQPAFIADGSVSVQWGVTIFTVTAFPRDSVTPFPRDVRVPVTVTTSAGDTERLFLSRDVCPGISSCHSLRIDLADGTDFERLSGRLDRRGARFTSLSAHRTSGTLFVFEPDEVPAVSAWLARQSGVQSAYLAQLGVVGRMSRRTEHTRLKGGMRLAERTGAVHPNNGHLDIRLGDTVTITIAQPDGSTHVFDAVISPRGGTP